MYEMTDLEKALN